MSLVTDEPDDLEGDIRAALAGDDPPAKDGPEPSVKEDETGRLHAADGKFASKAAKEDAPVDSKAEVIQPAKVETPAAEREDAILPPHTWTAASKAKFATLEPDIQQEILRREREFQDGLDQWKPKGEVYNKFDALIAPHRERLQFAGVDEFTYFRQLMAADEWLRRDPQAAMQELSRVYGFQLPNNPQQQMAQQMDPTVAALQQQVSQLTQHITSQQQSQEQAAQANVRSEIEAFRADPAHMYFDNVKPAMIALLKGEVVETLQEAYDRACYADPTVRALLTPTTGAKPQPGKPNGANVTGSPGTVKGELAAAKGDPNASIQDDVRAAIEELTGRV